MRNELRIRNSEFRVAPTAEGGFILPMALLLVVVLAISGMGFMQHGFLESRLAGHEVNNLGAFYLASAGLERAREALKIDTSIGQASWTTLLEDPDWMDPTPEALLCPDPAKGCAIAPFQLRQANPSVIRTDGEPVVSPDLPFAAGVFPQGWYSVRAFNNEEDPDLCPDPTADCDQMMTLRSLGSVGAEQTLLEATVKATSTIDLISCEGEPGQACPESLHAEATIEALPGREPAASLLLPVLEPPLDDPRNFYRNPNNFPWVEAAYHLSRGAVLTPESYTFYFVDGNVTIRDTGEHDHLVVFSTGKARLQGDVTLTDTIIVGMQGVQMRGRGTLASPISPVTYPAVISGGLVKMERGMEIYGPVYAEPTETIEVGAASIHGPLIGGDVTLMNAAAWVTDDGTMDYYGLMPGFFYPDELKTTAMVAGTWRELQ